MPEPPASESAPPTADSPAAPWAQEDILALVVPLRRFVASRLPNAHEVDDVVQDTLVRTLAARSRLEGGTLSAYAFTVARNLVTTGYRDAERGRRNLHRVVDLREPPRPEAEAIAAQERRALSSALADLPADQRALLLAHELDERPLAELAADAATQPASLAARLARTRARLRVDYVLALRDVTLPTDRCRPVLLAVSAGDRRRQVHLSAGAHLLRCRTCADLGPPLVARERALAGVVPWVALGAWHGHLVRTVRQHPTASVVAAGGAATAVAAAAVLGPAASPRDPAPPAPVAVTTTVAPTVAAPSSPAPTAAPPAGIPALRTGRTPLVPDAAHLVPLVGRTVQATRVRVLAVPSDEGFWVGDDDGSRVWVQLRTTGESDIAVRPGQLLSFTATVTANSPQFLSTVGRGAAASRKQLTAQQAHLAVAADRVGVSR